MDRARRGVQPRERSVLLLDSLPNADVIDGHLLHLDHQRATVEAIIAFNGRHPLLSAA